MNWNKRFPLLLWLLFSGGCGIYSFTGASIPPHLNNIYIPNFQDRTNAGIVSLSETITDELTTKIITQSSLDISSEGSADCRLDGTITTYSNQPYLVSQTTTTSNTNRITLRIQVTYTDLVNRKTIWEQNFENWSEYTLGDVSAEDAALEDAITKITDDIFSKVVSNW